MVKNRKAFLFVRFVCLFAFCFNLFYKQFRQHVLMKEIPNITILLNYYNANFHNRWNFYNKPNKGAACSNSFFLSFLHSYLPYFFNMWSLKMSRCQIPLNWKFICVGSKSTTYVKRFITLHNALLQHKITHSTFYYNSP